MENKPFEITNKYYSEMLCELATVQKIADLAVELATLNGEATTRPLSKQQLQRAVDACLSESRMVDEILMTWLRSMHDSGKLPDVAYATRLGSSNR